MNFTFSSCAVLFFFALSPPPISPGYSIMASLTDFVDFSQSSLHSMSDIIHLSALHANGPGYSVTAVSIAFNPIFWK